MDRGRGGEGPPSRGRRGGGRGGTPEAPPAAQRGGTPGPGRGSRGRTGGLGYAGPPTRGRGAASFSPTGARGAGGGRFSPGGHGGGGRGGGGRSSAPAQGSGARALRPGYSSAAPPNYREPHSSAKLFGSGAERVQFERDKEPAIWKVAPAPGQRFSPAFLQGVTNFIAFQLSRQQHKGGQAQPPPLPPPPPQQQQQQQQRAFPSQAAPAGGAGHGRAGQPPAAGSPGRGEATPCASEASPAMPPQVLRFGEEEQGPVAEEEQETDSSTGEAEGWAGDEASSSTPSTELAAAASASWDQQQRAQQGRAQAHNAAATAAASTSGCEPAPAAVAVRLELLGGGEAAGEIDSQAGNSVRLMLDLLEPSHPGQQQQQEEEEEEGASGGVGAEEEEEGGTPSSPSRGWWPANALAEVLPEALPVARVAEQEENEEEAGGPTAQAGRRGGRAAAAATAGCVQLSLRLERMGLTDREAGLLADWHTRQGPSLCLRKLWLFDNTLSDEGAAHVARMLHPGMLEVHLSHNRITLGGAKALLRALEVGAAPPPRPLWLRIEWNRISLEGLVQVLEEEHAQNGLVVDIPQPLSTDAAPSLPCLPSYLAQGARVGGGGGAGPESGQPEGEGEEGASESAAGGGVAAEGGPEGSDAAPSPSPSPPVSSSQLAASSSAAPLFGGASPRLLLPGAVAPRGGARNALQFLVGPCHARLPWLSCQYQLPGEAAVLKAARSTWGAAAALATGADAGPTAAPQPEALEGSAAPSSTGAGASLASPPAPAPSATQAAAPPPPPPVRPQRAQQAQRGPLLLFPDTSALLSMLGAAASVAAHTPFTLRALGELAEAGLFGRALEPQEQVFVVVTDSVAKQLDGLKADPAARAAIRHFMGKGLDAYGPAGLDFLTVLGGHEGEGLVAEHEAQVAGSRSRDVGSVGQKMDHKIVEVALFFQKEIAQAAAGAGAADRATTIAAACSSSSGSGCTSRPLAFPVVLLSGDNAQVQLAKSHGLPAVRMAELAPLERWLQAQQAQQAQRAAGALSASLIRKLVGAAATVGLGTVALRSIHREFDGAVACLRATADALQAAEGALAAVRAVLADASLAPEAALSALRSLLPAPAGSAGAAGRGGGGGSEGARSLASGEESGGGDSEAGQRGGLVAAVQQKLAEWEGLVQSQQEPSRVLRWAGAR